MRRSRNRRSPPNRVWLGLALGLVVAILAVPGTVAAQDDRFDFMPPGGVELLERTLERCEDCGALAELSTMDLDQPGWRNYLSERNALEDLNESAANTLIAWLAAQFPAESSVEAYEDLPRDGRTIVIQQCQICHSIAIPMLEDRTTEAWLQHRNRPPHDSFDLSDTEWQHIANYLSENAPIPEDDIPAEMRGGAGGY